MGLQILYILFSVARDKSRTQIKLCFSICHIFELLLTALACTDVCKIIVIMTDLTKAGGGSHVGKDGDVST